MNAQITASYIDRRVVCSLCDQLSAIDRKHPQIDGVGFTAAKYLQRPCAFLLAIDVQHRVLLKNAAAVNGLILCTDAHGTAVPQNEVHCAEFFFQ